MQYAFRTGGELIHTYENLFAFGITNHHDMFNEHIFLSGVYYSYIKDKCTEVKKQEETKGCSEAQFYPSYLTASS